MSNRNFSFLKRFKTEKTQRNNPVPGRPSNNKTPTSRIEKSNRSPAHEQNAYQKIQLAGKQNYTVKCANHSLKNACYELKQSLKQAYCQECSLKLVKYNIRMVRMTEQTLYLRALYEAEIQKLFDYEQQTSCLIQRYFQAQREVVRQSFILAKQSDETKVSVPIFKPCAFNETEFTLKLQELLGSVQMKKVEFVCHEPRDHVPKNQEKNESKQDNLYEQKYGENKENNKNYENTNGVGSWMDGRVKSMPSKQKKSVCLK